VEHPGRSAGPKAPDEEWKGIAAGTAGHGQAERLTEIVRMQRPPCRPALRPSLFSSPLLDKTHGAIDFLRGKEFSAPPAALFEDDGHEASP